jgi:hypothetical protein
MWSSFWGQLYSYALALQHFPEQRRLIKPKGYNPQPRTLQPVPALPYIQVTQLEANPLDLLEYAPEPEYQPETLYFPDLTDVGVTDFGGQDNLSFVEFCGNFLNWLTGN